MKRKKFFEEKNSFYNKQEGYTIVEILLVTLVMGLTFLLAGLFDVIEFTI